MVDLEDARAVIRGKRVAVVGGGPTVLENRPGFIDRHDVVVRVNNYRTGSAQGTRCDVFYSFFGGSIKKTPAELRAELAADGSLFGGYHPRMAAVHRHNAARITAMIGERGWPGYALAGVDGAAADVGLANGRHRDG